MTEINLSDNLVERIESRLKYTDFDDVDEYAEFVLTQVLIQVERDTDHTRTPDAPRESVENRLQSLGYLEE